MRPPPGSLDRHNQKIGHKNRAVFGELDGFPLCSSDDLAYLAGAEPPPTLTKANPSTALRAIGERAADNVRYFDVAHTIFPAAKLPHVVRDGRDCAISGWFHNLGTNPDWIRAKLPSPSADAALFAREWATDFAHAEQFAAARALACLTVRYEALLEDTAAVPRTCSACSACRPAPAWWRDAATPPRRGWAARLSVSRHRHFPWRSTLVPWRSTLAC
ncbi:MAG TPA: sulfotransferase [Acetobacteraceae bacterium]|nr:sulfotransferase [Acetobacteraceae bacterium]